LKKISFKNIKKDLMNLIKLNKSKILTEDNDKCIKLWDIQTGKYIMTIRNAFSYYI